jgi:hypothetical protein
VLPKRTVSILEKLQFFFKEPGRSFIFFMYHIPPENLGAAICPVSTLRS